MDEPAQSSADIRVLLADDHPVVRRGLSALLRSIPNVVVVGEASTGEEAVREATISAPDVVIMDLRMPVLDGVGATREILRRRPETAVLVLTMFDEDDLIADALRAGARGYLLKGAEQTEIERAIRVVAGGEVIFSRVVADKVIGRLYGGPPRVLPLPELTAREREVVDLMAGGAANTAIAEALGISGKTLSNHISSIFGKLGVATRAEAIVRARNAGLGGAG